MDYRKFLGASETKVLPYTGGAFVHSTDRRLRVTQPVAVGWWSFEIKGRDATALPDTGPGAEPPDLSERPRVRGHLVGPWLFTGGETAVHLHLMPEEAPAPFTPATARRWHGGEHLFEHIEFDDEAELAARERLEMAHSDADAPQDLVGVKGIGPSLRAAFGFARVQHVARARDMRISVIEVIDLVHEVALGTLQAGHLVDRVQARVFQASPTAHYRRERRRAAVRDALRATRDNAALRAARVLDAAGANLLSARIVSARGMEVAFRYMGERFVAMVDWETLHVFDSGICLDGADEELGLDSLPSVIGEAIESGRLHITAW